MEPKRALVTTINSDSTALLSYLSSYVNEVGLGREKGLLGLDDAHKKFQDSLKFHKTPLS